MIFVDWMLEGSCREVGHHYFFAEDTYVGGEVRYMYQEAIKVCNGCPVKKECLDFAIKRPEPYGVWGGMTPSDRRELVRGTKHQYSTRPF